MNKKILETKLEALFIFFDRLTDDASRDYQDFYKDSDPDSELKDYYLKMFKIFLLLNYDLQITKSEVCMLLDYRHTFGDLYET